MKALPGRERRAQTGGDTSAKPLFCSLVILIPIVFIHEVGHLLFGILFGVTIVMFSMGFGKPFITWKGGGRHLPEAPSAGAHIMFDVLFVFCVLCLLLVVDVSVVFVCCCISCGSPERRRTCDPAPSHTCGNGIHLGVKG